jgi:RND family efflux transporter MFP subunit
MKDRKDGEGGDTHETGSVAEAKPRSWWRRALTILLCLGILGAGMAGASYLNKTAPKARKRKPPTMDPLVRVEMVQQANERAIVRAMGTVVPALEMVLKSRVSGEIIATHPEFIEGGFLKKGTKILQIDPQDYELAVEQKRSQVVNAQYALKMELGHQEVAQREWELLKGDKPAKDLDLELALRKPHLEKARAELVAAEADLKQAKLDLARTVVRAPFNAIVRTKHVELGSQVSTQDVLAELVGADEYRIQVSIPVDRLKWITIPTEMREAGSAVRIIYGTGSVSTFERKGGVVKLLGDLDSEGRMARVLVSVKDPLDRQGNETKRPPLLIGDYVRVEIEGHELKDVFKIPRTALRDNSKIWVERGDGRLHIRQVEVVWRDPQYIFLRDGLKEGERLIVSDLATPVEGMAVIVEQPGGRGPGKGDSGSRKTMKDGKRPDSEG